MISDRLQKPKIVEAHSGEMRKFVWTPTSANTGIVAMWAACGPSHGYRERAFPTGTVRLTINLGEPYVALKNDCRTLLPAIWLSGIATRPRITELPTYYNSIVVLLVPSVARIIYAHPMSQLLDSTVDLKDVPGSGAAQILDQCLHAYQVEDQFKVIANWIASLTLGHETDGLIDRFANTIAMAGVQVPIDRLRKDLGVGRSRMAVGFKDKVGVGPKHFSRLVRLGSLLRFIQSEPNLVAASSKAGFADQPHMQKEVMALCGATPGQLMSNLNAHGQTTLERA